MKSISKISIITLLALSLFACKKENNNPENSTLNNTNTNNTSLIKIGETYIIGAKAKAVVYSTKAFETGYNELFVSLFDSIDGTSLSNGHFDISAVMNMGSMMHGCPVENTEDTVTTNGYFRSAVIFSMPGNTSQWTLNLFFHNHKNNLSGKGKLGINVNSSSPTKFISTTISADSNRVVFMSLIDPKNPVVGVNNFEMTVHEKVSDYVFKPITNYSIEIVPEMPSMNHGSPNNVNPVNAGNGHFNNGKVNYTMSGLWRIKLNIYKNNTLISNNQYFEMTLQ